MKKAEPKELFNDVSKGYSGLYGQLTENIKKYFILNILDSDCINRMLDVGNGGINPEDILSKDIANKLDLFVGNDLSFDMLTRTRRSIGVSVISDALTLPFKKKSFDTILVMLFIHHIGFKSEEKNLHHRLRMFLENLAPTLFFKWLKLPVVFSPYKMLFCKCRPKKSRRNYED